MHALTSGDRFLPPLAVHLPEVGARLSARVVELRIGALVQVLPQGRGHVAVGPGAVVEQLALLRVSQQLRAVPGAELVDGERPRRGCRCRRWCWWGRGCRVVAGVVPVVACQSVRQTDRQTDRQTVRQSFRQTVI